MKTVVDLIKSFEEWDKTAVVQKTGYRTFKHSYREFHQDILRTATLLENAGLSKGDKLIIWGYNSPQWGTVFLAAALKGVIVVPIDFLATGDFVGKIQQQIKAKLIFHSEFKLLPKLGVKDLVIEHLNHYIQDLDVYKKRALVNPADILEIVYTSGTTGDPKGVIITHGNLISNVVAIKKVVDVSPSQTFLSVLPMSHLFEQNPGFLAPLSAGCTVVYMRGLRPNLIFKVLAEERITNIVLVPRLLKLFETSIRREVEAKGKTHTFEKILNLNAPRSLKKVLFKPVHKKFGKHFGYFICGGAPLSDDLQKFWFGLGFRIVQGYGLTECSPVLTVNPLETSVVGSVGKPIPGVKLSLNKVGEVLAKGTNITQGYFQKPQQTKELFEQGWMNTGDIGNLDNNGYLFLKGRKKDVIVTAAGMNVYPEDVETALMRQKGVRDVCVVGLPSSQGEQVHAEILPLDPKLDIKKVVTAANLDLNESQRITSYGKWAKEDFPRTTTMKIKKPLVLAEVTGNQAKLSTPPPADSASKLHSLIARVCDVDVSEVKPTSTLALDLHLTSVNRIELVAFIEQEFNIDIKEDDINATTTVKELEDIVKKRAKVHESNIFRRWLLSSPLRIIRGGFNLILADNLLRVFVRRRVIGRENLKNLNGPVIFIANHVGYFDAPAIIMSLPWSIRQRIAPAAWKEYFENEGQSFSQNKFLRRLQLNFYYAYASVMVNAYPFPKNTGFKNSLAYTGELLDKKWHILFFPEGEHSPSGELQPFRSGIGWIVNEMKVPIIPIKHSGFENIMAGDAIQFPRSGKVTIKFGKPVLLDDRKSIPQQVNDLQKLLKDL
ncbi:MAG: AMP-binding protein [Patescibacteria group bacterium]